MFLVWNVKTWNIFPDSVSTFLDLHYAKKRDETYSNQS